MIIQNAAPRATHRQCGTHTRDVAQADRSGHRGGECLEVCDLTRVGGLGVLAGDHLQRDLEAAELDELEVHGEDDRGDDEPDDDEWDRADREEDDVAEDRHEGLEDSVDRLLDRMDETLTRGLRAQD